MCRQGASVIQTAVLDPISDPSLRAYVAWVPILPEDTSAPDEETRSLVPDPRASHFWDAERRLPGPLSRVLSLPEGWPAWDVYLAYPPGVRWESEPPAPAFWHHQLGDLAIAPRLDGEAFAVQLRSLLAGG
jgi:hypothetical protein